MTKHSETPIKRVVNPPNTRSHSTQRSAVQTLLTADSKDLGTFFPPIFGGEHRGFSWYARHATCFSGTYSYICTYRSAACCSIPLCVGTPLVESSRVPDGSHRTYTPRRMLTAISTAQQLHCCSLDSMHGRGREHIRHTACRVYTIYCWILIHPSLFFADRRRAERGLKRYVMIVGGMECLTIGADQPCRLAVRARSNGLIEDPHARQNRKSVNAERVTATACSSGETQ